MVSLAYLCLAFCSISVNFAAPFVSTYPLPPLLSASALIKLVLYMLDGYAYVVTSSAQRFHSRIVLSDARHSVTIVLPELSLVRCVTVHCCPSIVSTMSFPSFFARISAAVSVPRASTSLIPDFDLSPVSFVYSSDIISLLNTLPSVRSA